MLRKKLLFWLPPALSVVASIVFAIVLTVETINFRQNAAVTAGDDAKSLERTLDWCECAAGLLGACAVAAVMFVAWRLKQRLELVAAENAQIKAMEKFRRNFVSDVTHEIRTPITGITGAAEMLLDQPDKLNADERRELLGVIGAQARKLDRLTLDILSLARIESRKESGPLDFKPCDLKALLARTVDTFKYEAKSKGVKIEILRADEAEAACDAPLVEQAIGNLVENALRYSGSGRVELSLVRTSTQIAISVVDHGRGIPAAHQKRIFERFYQVDPSRSKGGTGLGLAIVKHIAALHGGESAVADTPGGGATFTLTIAR